MEEILLKIAGPLFTAATLPFIIKKVMDTISRSEMDNLLTPKTKKNWNHFLDIFILSIILSLLLLVLLIIFQFSFNPNEWFINILQGALIILPYFISITLVIIILCLIFRKKIKHLKFPKFVQIIITIFIYLILLSLLNSFFIIFNGIEELNQFDSDHIIIYSQILAASLLVLTCIISLIFGLLIIFTRPILHNHYYTYQEVSIDDFKKMTLNFLYRYDTDSVILTSEYVKDEYKPHYNALYVFNEKSGKVFEYIRQSK